MCGVHVSDYVCPVKVKAKVKAIVPIEESRREGKEGGGKRRGREGRKGRERRRESKKKGKKSFTVKKAILTKQSKGHKILSTVGTNQKSVA